MGERAIAPGTTCPVSDLALRDLPLYKGGLLQQEKNVCTRRSTDHLGDGANTKELSGCPSHAQPPTHSSLKTKKKITALDTQLTLFSPHLHLRPSPRPAAELFKLETTNRLQGTMNPAIIDNIRCDVSSSRVQTLHEIL